MVWNWLRRHPVLVDAGLVVAVFGVQLADVLARPAGSREAQLRFGAGIAFALLQTLPLLVRRRRPVAVLAIVTAGAIGSTLLYGRLVPLALGVAVYTVAAHCSRPRAALTATAALAAMAVPILRAVHYGAAGFVASMLFFLAAWILGDNMHTRRAYLGELEEKAERLERERESNIRRAAAEEQARISRELHDVIAHNVSVMTVQAAAGRDVFDSDPKRAREALGSIESTGRAALTELRRLLAAVRDGGRPELGPQPGLGALEELVVQVRSAGLDVQLSFEGDRPELPAALDLSAYRIVQEALTNTLKHAS